MGDTKMEIPETFTLLSLLEQDVYSINLTATKIEAQFHKTSKHINSIRNSIHTSIEDLNNNFQDIVNDVLSCFLIVEKDLSAVKFHADSIEEKRSEIVVCLSKVIGEERGVSGSDVTDVEYVSYSENLKNINLTLKDEMGDITSEDDNVHSPNNELQVTSSPSDSTHQNLIQSLKKTDELSSSEENVVVKEECHDLPSSSLDMECTDHQERRVESIRYSENLQNTYVRRDDSTDQGNRNINYGYESICHFNETGKDTDLSLTDGAGHYTTGDTESNVNAPANKFRLSVDPLYSLHSITEYETQIINKADDRLSRRLSSENKGVFEDKTSCFSSGGNEAISQVYPTIEACFSCPDCTESYSTKTNLERHIFSEHPYDEYGKLLVHRCNKCDRDFSSIDAIQRHVRDTHPYDHENFSCPVCNKMYVNKQSLKQHVADMHGNNEKMFACEKCEKTFKTIIKLKNHLRTHKEGLVEAGGKDYVCVECSESFRDKWEYETHIKLHLGVNLQFPCKLCKRGYGRKDHLRRHVEVFHSKIKRFKCSMCDKEYAESKSLKDHLITHTGEKYLCELCNKGYSGLKQKKAHIEKYHGMLYFMYTNLTCEICSKQFENEGDLFKHLKTDHPDNKPFKCTDCEECFSKYGLLLEHMNIHSVDKPHQCQECGKCFGEAGNLQIHVKSHTGERPFKCKECERSFSQSSALRKHVHTHMEKLQQCPHCPEKFTFKKSLDRHILTHTGKYPFLCQECGRGFVRQEGLTVHMRIVHTGEQFFKCEQCEATFIKKADLQQHIKVVHNPKKPEEQSGKVCEVCGSVFSSSNNLWRHRLIHSGKRVHKCPHCPMDFPMTRDLKNHIRVHTGEKPYKCEDCGKCFTQKTNLQVHRRSHTGEKPYVCECGKAFAHRVSLNSHRKTTGGMCGGGS